MAKKVTLKTGVGRTTVNKKKITAAVPIKNKRPGHNQI